MIKKSKIKLSKKSEIKSTVLDHVIRASSLLTRDMNYKHLISVLVEQSLDITRSDLAVYYSYNEQDPKSNELQLNYKRGKWECPDFLERDSSLLEFIEESNEAVLVLRKSTNTNFPRLFINDKMKSAIALPIFTPDCHMGLLVMNSLQNNFFNRSKFQFLDSFTKLASGMINNARLFNNMKESYKIIENLERYQKSIFSSMSDLLLTLDSDGNLYYANEPAKNSFKLDEISFGKSYRELFQKSLSNSILNSIDECCSKGKRYLGLEGIYKESSNENDMDFKLNISPLMADRGKNLGSILIFTDEVNEYFDEDVEKMINNKGLII